MQSNKNPGYRMKLCTISTPLKNFFLCFSEMICIFEENYSFLIIIDKIKTTPHWLVKYDKLKKILCR